MKYQVIFSKRKTIGISVERDANVIVRAPDGTSTELIENTVKAKKLWLFEKTRSALKYSSNPPRKELVTGETLLYLGRHYRVEVVDAPISDVQFRSKFYIPKSAQRDVAGLLREWYKRQALERITKRASEFAQSLGVTYRCVTVSELKYSWGSCTPKNTLNFNWRIIKAPAYVIDYLVVHELAHLLEANHTKRFWNIVAVQAPDYRRARQWLQSNGAVLEVEFGPEL